MKNLIVLLVVLLALFANVSGAGAEPSITAITPVCDDKILVPNQDSAYPPEGYHCRPLPEGVQEQERTRDNNPVIVPVAPTVIPLQPVETVVPVVPPVIVPNVPTEQPTQPVNPPVVPTAGNPGNNKPVGQAGEHCSQGMCENGDGTGEHGNSPNN